MTKRSTFLFTTNISALLLSCILIPQGVYGTGITSVGAYASEEYHWAVGIPSLTFTFIYECPGQDTCEVKWLLNDELKGRATRLYDDSIPRYYCEGDNNTTCYYNNSRIETNFTQTHNVEAGHHVIRASPVPSNGDKERNFTLTYCSAVFKNFANQTLNIHTNSSTRPYHTIGMCNCSHGSLRYNNGTNHSGMAICGSNAQWDGCSDAQCWFAASNIKARQTTDVAGETASFKCEYEDAFPPVYLEETYVGGVRYTDERNLTYDDNGRTFHCEVYSKYNGDIPSKSQSCKLDVFFGPDNLYPTNLKHRAPENSSVLVEIGFRAHDRNDSVSAEFVKMEDNSVVSGNLTNTSETFYTFHAEIFINSNGEEYGMYQLNVSTADPKGSQSATFEILNSTAELTTASNNPENSPNYGLIGGLCGGAVALIVLLTVLIWAKRHCTSKANEPEKEERINEIYGTAQRSSETEVKQDKSNVLYETSGGDVGVEEAYAEVDKRKKKKSKGSDNSAYSPEVEEVMYTTVKKPKKGNAQAPQEAVYSAVDKKKKGQSGKESGLHGSRPI